MTLTTSDWVAIIGIILATVIGLMAWAKKESGKSNQIHVEQKSGTLSKGNQKQNVNINTADD